MRARRLEPFLFGFVLSGCMSLVVSAVAAWRTLGPAVGVQDWMRAWVPAWVIAYPIVLVAAPLARRIVQGLLAWGVRTGWLSAEPAGPVP